MTEARQGERRVFVERAGIISQQTFPGQQIVMRLHAPNCAAAANPGQFIHLRCSAELPMRRPYSIMRVSRSDGWLEILYRTVGRGSRLLSAQPAGRILNTLGPIGRGFNASGRQFPLLLGGGVGMPPILFLAQQLSRQPAVRPLALLASERGFPFCPHASDIAVEDFSDSVNLNHPWLESWGIAGRLCSRRRAKGFFQGNLTDMAARYLSQLSSSVRRQHAVFACGPESFLRKTSVMARRWRLHCQLCLEEFMACGVGGCAGCAVEATDSAGRKSMRRVCVDGPVFEAREIYPFESDVG